MAFGRRKEKDELFAITREAYLERLENLVEALDRAAKEAIKSSNELKRATQEANRALDKLAKQQRRTIIHNHP